MGLWGAGLTIVGTLFSGPLAQVLTMVVQPQPAWQDAQTFVENFHRVQTVTFYSGFLLLSGSVAMMSAIYLLAEEKAKPLLGVIFISIGVGLVSFNYFTQAAFLPALAEHYDPAMDQVIAALTMVNPISLTWAVEMWGYGFMGLGTWFAASFFGRTGLEGIGRWLFIVNGVLSVIGALVTAFDLGWVLSIPGLIAYVGWNLLYLALAAVFYVVLRRRERQATGRLKRAS